MGRLLGLGSNTHFGIKYKYNSAKSNKNCFSRLEIYIFNTNTLPFYIQMLFKYIVRFFLFDSNTWSLPAPWGTSSVKYFLQYLALLGERHIKDAINGYFEG